MFLKRLKNPWTTAQEMVKFRDKTIFILCKKIENTNISLNNLSMTKKDQNTLNIIIIFFQLVDKRVILL
jgi:hypothetical protein